MFSFLITALLWLSASYVCFLGVQLVQVLLSDCDLILSLYERWGRRPAAELRGKVVWITGASSGIGEELAYQLARVGAKLVLSARGEEDLRKVADKCKDLSPVDTGDAHTVLPLDLLDTALHQSHTNHILDQYGRIDVLVNNAGRSQRAVASDTALEVDRAIIELNTVGTLSLTKAVLPHMVKQRDGQIVVISSVAGVIGAPGSASYSTSKHALHGFFNTLRMEIVDSGVSVHMVCPGPVQTPYFKRQFGDALDKKPTVHQTGEKDQMRMSAERCAHLISVTIANRLDEVWISKNPILLFVYLNQYAPNFTRWLGKKIGNKRAKAVKAGKKIIDDSFFSK